MEGLRYFDVEHILLRRLAAEPAALDGSLTDLQELLADLEHPDWVVDCGLDLDERGYIQATLAFGNSVSARMLPAGRRYLERIRADAETFKSLGPLIG